MGPGYKNGKKGGRKKPALRVINGGLDNGGQERITKGKKGEPLVDDNETVKLERKLKVWRNLNGEELVILTRRINGEKEAGKKDGPVSEEQKKLDKRLVEGLWEGNVFKVKDAIDRGASLLATDEDGNNILEIAASVENEEVIRFLNSVLEEQYEKIGARYGRYLDMAGQRPFPDMGGDNRDWKLAERAPTPREILDEVSAKYHAYDNAREFGGGRVFFTLGYVGTAIDTELEDMKKVFRICMAANPYGISKDVKYMRRSGRYAAAVIALIAADYEEIRDVSREMLDMLESKSKTTRRSGIMVLGILSKRGIYLPGSKEKLKELAENDTEPKVRREAENTLKLYP